MIRKTAQHEQVQALRKRGFTYREIAKIVGVSISTVSSWIVGMPHEIGGTWQDEIKEDIKKRAARENKKRISLLNTARGNQFKKLYDEAERSAITEFKHYLHNPLFVAGLMAYAALGDHTDDGRIRLTSTRMEPQRVFVQFAKEFLGVSRENVHIWLSLYPAHNEEVCMRKWSRKLSVSIAQFHKNQIIEGRSSKGTLHYGVGNTIIGGKVLKKKLLKWIELASKEL